jgi:hypothetical protein
MHWPTYPVESIFCENDDICLRRGRSVHVAKHDVDAISVADYLLALGKGGLVTMSFKMTSRTRGQYRWWQKS